MTVNERRSEQLRKVQDHLATAAQGLADAGYPNEAGAIQRLVTVVGSHRSNAETKRKNRG